MHFYVSSPLILLLATLSAAHAGQNKFKFLAYSPQFANSHVNFMGKISDALVDAGHDVTMISQVIDAKVGTSGTKKARVIEIPQPPSGAKIAAFMDRTQRGLWTTQSGWDMIKMSDDQGNVIFRCRTTRDGMELWARTCDEIISNTALIDNLRAQKYDVAYAEPMDFCAFAIFHLAGIEKIAVTSSFAVLDGMYFVTQTPFFPSYVPSMMMGSSGDVMTFYQRMSNFISVAIFGMFGRTRFAALQPMLEARHPGFPLITDVAANASLVFLNSEPLVDFPRVTSHRIVEVGGIVVTGDHGVLNKTWSDIMNLRPHTILLSFGTFAKAHTMPETYKTTIRDTLAMFPDVTFIWKYEIPSHNVSGGVPNIIETTWVPQVDMLYDPRLTAFITHCGQGSTTEANLAGVPLLVTPIGADQLRNAQQVKRNGVGIFLDKTLLASPGPLETALRELLDNHGHYQGKARQLAAIIKDRPLKMKEVFVWNMEFLVKYGPLRQLDHAGRHLNFFQFYGIDVVAFLALVVSLVLVIACLTLRSIGTKLLRALHLKRKVE